MLGLLLVYYCNCMHSSVFMLSVFHHPHRHNSSSPSPSPTSFSFFLSFISFLLHRNPSCFPLLLEPFFFLPYFIPRPFCFVRASGVLARGLCEHSRCNAMYRFFFFLWFFFLLFQFPFLLSVSLFICSFLSIRCELGLGLCPIEGYTFFSIDQHIKITQIH